MATKGQIINALRCQLTDGSRCPNDERCPYYKRDVLTMEALFGLADGVDENGNRYCHGCDTDKLLRDAADALEGTP